MLNATDQFRDAIQSAGLIPPDVIEPDGKLHRFASNGKHGDDAGWYALHGDGIPAGSFGDWRSGINQTWRADIGRNLSKEEEAADRARVRAMQTERKAEEQRRHKAAAEKATAIYGAGRRDEAAEHPYAAKKRVNLFSLVRRGAWPQRGWNDALLIPLYDATGAITTLEAINPDDDKDFLIGGRKRGCFHPLGKLRGAPVVLIGEGLASTAVGTDATGYPSAAAMDAGNLLPVAQAIRNEIATDALIVFLADNDVRDDGRNPGIEAAQAAAQAVGGIVAVPEMEGQKCDWWNVWDKHGPEAVAEAIGRAIAGASAPGKATHQAEPLRAGERMAPEPLRAMLPPADGFPVQSLGAVLGGAAAALHESVKAPLALCCQSVLAAASFAVQAHANIKMPWGEVKPSTLFFLTVGESGERKSAIDDLVLGAAKAQERADMAIYNEELKQYQVAAAAHEHAVDAARRAATTGKKGTATQAEVMAAVERCGKKPSAPVAPLRFVTDPTVEGLFKLMVVSQPSVALFSDEGGLLIGGHALNSDNALKTFARWCKLWDGSPFDRVRAGDGAGILYGRRMALHQLAQPDVMVKLLSDRMANGQGLLARCLVAWPATTIGTRYMERFAWAGDLPAMRRLYAVFKGMLEATPATGDESGQELTPFELELSPDANALAVAASNQFETLMASGADLSELRDRTSKALENACRIAGILAVIEGGLSVRLIESEHLQRALVLMQWYLAEALRIRGAAAVPQSVGDAETLSAWLRDRGLKMFRTKQVLHAGPSQLRNKSRLLSAINELVTAGYLIENGPGMVVDGVSARKSWEVIHHVV
jgi:putative DNA primase/helicase